MTHDVPPPFPPLAEDPTQFSPSIGAPPPQPPPMPPNRAASPLPSGRATPRRARPAGRRDPAEPLNDTHTNTRFAIPAHGGTDTDMGPAGRERRNAADARIRQPAPQGHQPPLLPNAESARQVRGPKTIRPGVINPVRPKNDTGRGFGDNSREASDVISSFQQPEGQNQASPRPLTTEGKLRSRRQPTAAPRQAPARAAGGRQAPARQTYNPPQRAPAPAPTVLPLSQEQLGQLIADQRRRLHVLYGYARGLEIAAGILGTLSLAVLIASLVSILVGSGATVVASASALAGSATGLALTLIMVVAAVAIRQLAHSSAQVAALIEALCQPPSRDGGPRRP